MDNIKFVEINSNKPKKGTLYRYISIKSALSINTYYKKSIIINYLNNSLTHRKEYISFLSVYDRSLLINLYKQMKQKKKISAPLANRKIINLPNKSIINYIYNYIIIKFKKIKNYYNINSLLFTKNIFLKYIFIVINQPFIINKLIKTNDKCSFQVFYSKEELKLSKHIKLINDNRKIYQKHSPILMRNNSKFNSKLKQIISRKGIIIKQKLQLNELNKIKTYLFEVMVKSTKDKTYLFFSSVRYFEITNSNNFYKKIILFNIQRIETNINKKNELTLIIENKENIENYSICFKNLFEKFIFQSIIYNCMLKKNKIDQIDNDNNNERKSLKSLRESLSKKEKDNKEKKDNKDNKDNTEDLNIPINVKIITWNLGNAEEQINLLQCFTQKELTNVDILVIGVQECNINKKNDWLKSFKLIFSLYNFVEVTSNKMFQMFIIVAVKKHLYGFIDCIYTETKAMGKGNIIGNKGGILISFKLLDYQFVFINCHLAPKPKNAFKRNKMIKDILKTMKLPNNNFSELDICADYIFWFGDMNYRVDLSFDDAIDVLYSNTMNNGINLLLEKDELKREMDINNVFFNFHEGDIDFYPTYRRDKNKEKDINEKISQYDSENNKTNYKLNPTLRYSYAKHEIKNSNEYNKKLIKSLTIDDRFTFDETTNNNKNNIKKNTNLENSDKNLLEKTINFQDRVKKLNNMNKVKSEVEKTILTTIKKNTNKKIDDNLIQNDPNYTEKIIELFQYNNKKDQAPSWCDRILINTNNKYHIPYYSSLKNIRWSDHLPVESRFELNLINNNIMDFHHFANLINFNSGSILYIKFHLMMNFNLIFEEELNAELKFPFYVYLKCYFDLIEDNSNNYMSNEINDEIQINKFIDISPLNNNTIFFIPEYFLNFTQIINKNVYFAIYYSYNNTKELTQIGYAKYSFNQILNEKYNLYTHQYNIDVVQNSRNVGILTVDTKYKI